MKFEYKVVVAPVRGTKSKGVRGTAERFALSLETQMNDCAAEGWEYHRTETLPAQRRGWLGRRHVEEQNLLVFRRAVEEAAAEPALSHSANIAAAVSNGAAPVAPPIADDEAAARVRRLFRPETANPPTVAAE
ncbi:DUF4177 domain-containing protein [Poseidonocella sedimentorum]|uniref:DUF4177 domain-containing protein n=1 Tax=Poseidonocella sedimentorum TaxID=871652 RepID=A0A1I6CP48_9RHOB|nr:DUF4177 domain-containing protein [Poseidonocella sedimentorum]SFQ94934.1 hypothetical protein SAMN04515673_101123 [Poseidonocella sedimentorum]